MVYHKKTTDESGTIDLVKSYSSENKKLLQVERSEIYGSSVVDTIAGYDDFGVPYPIYTYEETDEPIPQPEPEPEFEETEE